MAEQQRSWDLPIGDPLRIALESMEANWLGLSKYQYLQLSVDERKKRFLASQPELQEATPSGSHDTSMHPDDRRFWQHITVASAIWAAIFVTVFGYGLYSFIEGFYWWGGLLTPLGLAGAGAVALHLAGRNLSLHYYAAIALVLTWVSIGYQIWETRAETPPFNLLQQQLANLPTSPDGLAPGTVWSDGGVLAVTSPVTTQQAPTSQAQDISSEQKTISDLERRIDELNNQKRLLSVLPDFTHIVDETQPLLGALSEVIAQKSTDLGDKVAINKALSQGSSAASFAGTERNSLDVFLADHPADKAQLLPLIGDYSWLTELQNDLNEYDGELLALVVAPAQNKLDNLDKSREALRSKYDHGSDWFKDARQRIAKEQQEIQQ